MKTVLKVLLGIVLAFAVIAGGMALWGYETARHIWSPDPETIASASLQGLQEENRLTALVATYVAVVTSSQTRLGLLSAQRTLIMPGRVRYEVDLGQLRRRDLVWHAGARDLDITLPPLTVEGPEVQLSHVREYDSGGLLLHFTDTGATLDASNRKAGEAELLREAQEPAPMQIARDAARRAVEQSFALPLRAAGLDARVRVRFQGETGFPPLDDRPMQRSRSLSEVLGLSR